MTSSSDSIETQAAQWLIQTDLAGSREQWLALDAWLAANPRNRAAFLRLSVSWRRADQFRSWRACDGTVDPDLLSHRASGAPEAAVQPRKWRPAWAFGLRAAAVAAVLLVAIYALAPFAAGYFSAQVYATEVGNQQHIRLADGSTVDLNTDSELRVHFNDAKRGVTLIRGEASFKVVRDPQRPFDVRAGEITVRAVGTAFSVRLRDFQKVEVRVTEGRVAIDPPPLETLGAGDTATVTHGNVLVKSVPVGTLTKQLQWTEGRLYFSGETLVEVIDEFNRYNRRQLLIADPAIADLRISGTFAATDPETFLTTLRSLPAARAAGAVVLRLEGKDK